MLVKSRTLAASSLRRSVLSCWTFIGFLSLQGIPTASHGANERMSLAGAQFLAQMADMHLDTRRIPNRCIVKEALFEYLIGEDMTRLPDKAFQKVKFQFGELNHPGTAPSAPL